MNLSVLLQVAGPHVASMPYDEPNFSLPFDIRRKGLPTDAPTTSALLPIFPKGPVFYFRSVRLSMLRVFSTLASVEDIVFQSLPAFPGAVVQAMLMYMCLVDAMPSALSNHVLQQRIFKCGPQSLFHLCRRMKLASAANIVSAGVVQKEPTFRSDTMDCDPRICIRIELSCVPNTCVWAPRLLCLYH